MILASRPLRFLAGVLGGWTVVRAAMLWPTAGMVPTLVRAIAPSATAEAKSTAAATVSAEPRRDVVRTMPDRAALLRSAPRPFGDLDLPKAVGSRSEIIASDLVRSGVILPEMAQVAMPGVDPPATFRASRWSGSGWAILRPNGRATPFASQLGGSQAGARLAYAIDPARRVALYARASSAIEAPEREAAIGVDWRPTRLPVHIIAERRIGIEGVRGGTAIGAVGGVGPTRVAGPVRIEGYAQGGVIFRNGHEGFFDGSLRLTAPAAARVDFGLGAWGGAQKGAARVDVGPTIGVTLPVERHALRLSVDWRQRVAGDARPGSGPAVSLGADF